jgi:hypothetical protein
MTRATCDKPRSPTTMFIVDDAAARGGRRLE